MSTEQFVHKALDALIAAGEAAGVDQILPDRHGVAAAGEPKFDGVNDAPHRRSPTLMAAAPLPPPGATPKSVVTSMAGFAWPGSATTAVATAAGTAAMVRSASRGAPQESGGVANSAPKSMVTLWPVLRVVARHRLRWHAVRS